MPNNDALKGQSGLDTKQQIKFLKRIDFFDNFDNHELKQFLAVTRWIKVPQHTQIIKEGSMERVFYILVKGEVAVVKTIPGQKDPLQLTTLKTGACFGEMSLVMDVERTAGIVTTTESYILMVEPGIISTSNVFLQLKFYKRFCEILVSRLITANEKIAGLEKPEPTLLSCPAPPREFKLKGSTRKKESQPAPGEDKPSSTDKPEQLEPELTTETEHQQPAPLPSREDTILPLPPVPEKKDRILKKRLQRKLATALDLPINPAVIAAIEPYLIKECDNTRLLAEFIHLDPVLSCKVLQVANSSFFRRSTPVYTVPHAMVTVGIKQVQEALLESIHLSRGFKPFSGFKAIGRSFWRHSVMVARITALLKDVIRISTSVDVYLAGLVHDIGILALDPIEKDFYPNLLNLEAGFKNNLCESETTYIGLDHGIAGACYGEAIGLAEPCLDAMRFHHNPEDAKDNTLITALVCLADHFATERGCGIGGKQEMPPIIQSFGWVLLQEQHRPFIDVNLADFIHSFNKELDNTWSGLTDGLQTW